MSTTHEAGWAHAPGALQTLQAGMPFFASAALQFLAYALAVWYFSRAQISSGSGGTKPFCSVQGR